MKTTRDPDLSFRPETYWKHGDPIAAVLSGIKGEVRREQVRAALEAGREVPEGLLHSLLEEPVRHVWGGIHPLLMGGEYLPTDLPGETTIARISYRSTTGDVTEVRARPGGPGILYRFVDEYETEFVLPFDRSNVPLSMGELIELIDNTQGMERKPGFVWPALDRSLGMGSAILKLRREDLDLDRLPHGWVRFRAENDKTGHEQWVPLTQLARGLVLEHLGSLAPREWLFPSERKPSQPVDRRTMDRRLEEAYKRAGLEPLEGGLWHPWRRKWATERKGMPVKDVAAAGGWSDTATLLRSYQQSDEATLTQVVLDAPKLTTNGSGGTEVTPLLTPPRPPPERVTGRNAR